MKIKNRKHVIIRSGLFALGAVIQWNTSISNVSFIPDEVHVKSVAYDGNNDQQNYELRTNLTDETSPFVIIEDTAGTIYPPNVHHTMKKPTSGQFSFTLFDRSNAIATSTVANTNMLIHLEFVEYEKDK